MEVGAVACFIRTERDILQITQMLDAVALQVGFILNRGVTQLWPRLDVEQEEQPVHEAQALQAQLFSQIGVRAVKHLFLGHLALVVQSFVGNQFDALTQGVLQVSRNLESMLVRAFIQPVQQRDAPVCRQDGFLAQQGYKGPQALFIPRAKQLGQVKAQHGLARPFGPLHQQPLLVMNQQHPARRVIVGKYPPGQRFFPIQPCLAQRVTRIIKRRQCQRRASLPFLAGRNVKIGSCHDHQQWLAFLVTVDGQRGNLSLPG